MKTRTVILTIEVETNATIKSLKEAIDPIIAYDSDGRQSYPEIKQIQANVVKPPKVKK